MTSDDMGYPKEVNVALGLPSYGWVLVLFKTGLPPFQTPSQGVLEPELLRDLSFWMSAETYLNHPNFGMLFRICMIDDYRELFATLYAQRLFFVVNSDKRKGLVFDPISRSDARLMLENRIRVQRRIGSSSEYDRLQTLYKQTFQ